MLACAAAGAARAALDVGVTEDAGKTGDGGAAFFATLNDVGLNENRVSINWDAANPTAIAGRTRSPPDAAGPGRGHRGSSSRSSR